MTLGSEKLFAAFNQQVGNEMGASMQYISIASYFDQEGLGGLARFFYRQSEEEREHAMKFVNFIVDAGGPLRIPQIAAPRAEFGSASDAVQAALDWETEVTRQIYDLVDIAKEEKNYIAHRFLDWFVDEQFEEVTTMEELLQVVERAGDGNLLAVEEYLSREGMLPERPPEGPE